jgi:hypothetical protein
VALLRLRAARDVLEIARWQSRKCDVAEIAHGPRDSQRAFRDEPEA